MKNKRTLVISAVAVLAVIITVAAALVSSPLSPKRRTHPGNGPFQFWGIAG